MLLHELMLPKHCAWARSWAPDSDGTASWAVASFANGSEGAAAGDVADAALVVEGTIATAARTANTSHRLPDIMRS
jgi:hypothetical protein